MLLVDVVTIGSSVTIEWKPQVNIRREMVYVMFVNNGPYSSLFTIQFSIAFVKIIIFPFSVANINYTLDDVKILNALDKFLRIAIIIWVCYLEK